MTTTPEVPMPATYPYVERIVRIFRDRLSDDTSAIVLLDFARAYANARCAALQADLREANSTIASERRQTEEVVRGLHRAAKEAEAERDALAARVKDINQCSATTQALIDMLIERDNRGLAKYGQTLDRTDLTHEQWLQHMAEEMLDGAGYALAAIRTDAAIDAASGNQA